MKSNREVILKLQAVVACTRSHVGIMSITDKAKQITGSQNITAIIGCYHLIDAEDERIEKIVKSLKELKVKKIYTDHFRG